MVSDEGQHIPNAELHIHVEGAIDPEILVELARRNGVQLPTYDIDTLQGRYVFDDLQDFLDLRDTDIEVLRTEDDFYDLGRHYLEGARAAGVVRAEAFIDPMVHMRRGVPIEAVMGGFGAAFDEARATSLSCDLIVCFTRNFGADVAQETLDAVLPFRDSFIGVGLDSTEIGYPPSLFKDVYTRAAAEDLHLVAHAGEEGGPDYVLQALDDLHVERIDHGLRALEDPALMARIVDEQVALTVCPLSNIALRAVDSMQEHPVFAMLEMGARVTISSDDPAFFGGHVDANFDALKRAGATDSQLRQLAENSFHAAFISTDERILCLEMLGRA